MESQQPQQPPQTPGAHLPFQPTPSPPTIPLETIFRRLQSYPFHSDPSYQSGLSTILGHPSAPATPSELSSNPDLILQTQVFYFARKHGLESIDVTEYKNFLDLTASFQQSQSLSEPPQRNDDTPPLLKPDPVPRPSAPTPNSAAAAPTIPIPTHPETLLPPSTSSPNTTTSPSATAPSQDANPPYPTSFADIVDLITQNKPIPGIETIPDTVLEPGSSKQDHTTRRKKPWEKTEETHIQQSLPTEIPSMSADNDNTNVETSTRTGEGVIRILQPDAIPDSGLLAKE